MEEEERSTRTRMVSLQINLVVSSQSVYSRLCQSHPPDHLIEVEGTLYVDPWFTIKKQQGLNLPPSGGQAATMTGWVVHFKHAAMQDYTREGVQGVLVSYNSKRALLVKVPIHSDTFLTGKIRCRDPQVAGSLEDVRTKFYRNESGVASGNVYSVLVVFPRADTLKNSFSPNGNQDLVQCCSVSVTKQGTIPVSTQRSRRIGGPETVVDQRVVHVGMETGVVWKIGIDGTTDYLGQYQLQTGDNSKADEAVEMFTSMSLGD
jgi:hypothetical protein